MVPTRILVSLVIGVCLAGLDAHAQAPVNEGFDARPSDWVLDPQRHGVDNGRLYLGGRTPARAPGEWESFVLEMDAKIVRGSFEIRYGTRCRVEISRPIEQGQGHNVRVRVGSNTSDSISIDWHRDRRLVLRVAGNLHTVVVDGQRAQARGPHGRGAIELASLQDGVAEIDRVRIRSLELSLVDVVPQQVTAGKRSLVYAIGEGFDDDVRVGFRGDGVNVVGEPVVRSRNVLQIVIDVAAEATGTRTLTAKRSDGSQLNQIDAFRIVPPPAVPEPPVLPPPARIDALDPPVLRPGVAGQSVLVQGSDLGQLASVTVLSPATGVVVLIREHRADRLELSLDVASGLGDRVVRLEFAPIVASEPALHRTLWVRAEPPETPHIQSVQPLVLQAGVRDQRVVMSGTSLSSFEGVRVVSPRPGFRATWLRESNAGQIVVSVDVPAEVGESAVQLELQPADPSTGPLRQVLGIRLEAPETSTSPTGWLIGLGGGLLVSFWSGYGWGRTRALEWLRWAKRRWEDLSQLEDSRPLVACRWICRSTPKTELANWEIDEIRVTPLVLGGAAPEPEAISGAALADLNDRENVKAWLLDRDKLASGLRPAAKAVSQIVAQWSEQGASPAEVRLTAKFQKPVQMHFELKHCELSGGELQWVTRRRWTRTAKPGRPLEIGVITGPRPDEAFVERIADEAQAHLLDLFQRVRSLP